MFATTIRRRTNPFHSHSRLEFVHPLRDALLRQHVEVEPRHTALDANVAGERSRQEPYARACLFGCHALDGEVARLAQQVRG